MQNAGVSVATANDPFYIFALRIQQARVLDDEDEEQEKHQIPWGAQAPPARGPEAPQAAIPSEPTSAVSSRLTALKARLEAERARAASSAPAQ
jgi:hypothetical protein